MDDQNISYMAKGMRRHVRTNLNEIRANMVDKERSDQPKETFLKVLPSLYSRRTGPWRCLHNHTGGFPPGLGHISASDNPRFRLGHEQWTPRCEGVLEGH